MMIFFLLPFIFNPFGLLTKWLPILYLASWPIIIQTLGRETLLSHALLLVIFILTCDVVRDFMIRLIGIDLISTPAGIALIALIIGTDIGASTISFSTPLFNGLLSLIEPIFLFLETYLVLDMIKSFNKWISRLANTRSEDSHDLSNWEPQLTRKAILVRIIVIVLTAASYFATYWIVQKAKVLHSHGSEIPMQFNQAIALLVTLQLIALSVTIYKEEGIVLESAQVSLIASVPILIASLSYYNLKETSQSSSWNLMAYFPFSILNLNHQENEIETSKVSYDSFGFDQPMRFAANKQDDLDTFIQFSPLEASVNQMELINTNTRQLLLEFSKKLIMLINSILGLSLEQLGKFYFGPNFWYLFAGRLVCLSWLSLLVCRPEAEPEAEAASQGMRASVQNNANLTNHRHYFFRLKRSTLIKLLFVLVYTQMLLSQTENEKLKLDLFEQQSNNNNRLTFNCCQQKNQIPNQQQQIEKSSGLLSWFDCVWTNLLACTLNDSNNQTSFWTKLAGNLYAILMQFFSLFHWIQKLWLQRIWSPIVQRLIQSMLIQVSYISLLLFNEGEETDRSTHH